MDADIGSGGVVDGQRRRLHAAQGREADVVDGRRRVAATQTIAIIQETQIIDPRGSDIDW